MSAELPNKLYFRIGEVARIVGEAAHVLRFWEQEFTGVRPQKSPSGQRVYARKDVARLLAIKQLLRERGFTLEGARKELARVEETAPTLGDEPAVDVSAWEGVGRSEALREGLLRARAVLVRALGAMGVEGVAEGGGKSEEGED